MFTLAFAYSIDKSYLYHKVIQFLSQTMKEIKQITATPLLIFHVITYNSVFFYFLY